MIGVIGIFFCTERVKKDNADVLVGIELNLDLFNLRNSLGGVIELPQTSDFEMIFCQKTMKRAEHTSSM